MSDFHNPFFVFVNGRTIGTNRICDALQQARASKDKEFFDALKIEQKKHHEWLKTTHDPASIRKREWRRRRNDT